MSTMAFTPRPHSTWKLRTRTLAIGERTLVMGIVNVTPDSFSGDTQTRLDSTYAAVEHALRLLDEGAAILDIGGESTRPGSHAGTGAAISAQQEQDRVLPVIEAIVRSRPSSSENEYVISIDTYRASTARTAGEAGAEIVNDVSGLLWDEAMGETCAELACGVVLMHTRGRPDEWKNLPGLRAEEALPLVKRELEQRLQAACACGIAEDRIVLDPGYGFGKAFHTNYPVLAAQDKLLELGRPLLAGISRKSFLGRTLAPLYAGVEPPPRERGAATLAATVAAVLAGASIVRVHDVRQTVEAVAIADAIVSAAQQDAAEAPGHTE